jgi:hypothetical protein
VRGVLRHRGARRLALFTTLGCGILALLAPVASAFSASVAFNGCASVSFNYHDFTPGNPVTATETLSVNGVQVASQPFAFTPSAPNLTETDSIPIADRHNGDTLVASTTYSVPTQGVFNAVVTSPPYTLAGCATSTTIVTTASSAVLAGGQIFDAAALSGGTSPTGTITFNLFGPGDTTCSKSLSTSTATVNGNASYASAPFTATTPGTYQWTASYSGDTNNSPAAEACGQAAEQVIVVAPGFKAQPTITTTFFPAKGCVFPVGKAKTCKVADAATLSGGVAPTGTITFNLYAASDTTCSNALSTSTVPVNGGNGIYASSPVSESKPHGYQWTASYSGDANNAAATEGCGSEKIGFTRPAASACVAVSASLKGPFGTTIARAFTARLKVIGAKSVTFYLDGHKLATVKKAHGGAFSITINTPSLSIGLHTVLAKVQLKQKSCKLTRKASFVHGIGPGS